MVAAVVAEHAAELVAAPLDLDVLAALVAIALGERNSAGENSAEGDLRGHDQPRCPPGLGRPEHGQEPARNSAGSTVDDRLTSGSLPL